MLTLVNEELMSFQPAMGTDKISGKIFFKLKILTSNHLLQRQSDIKGNGNRKPKPAPDRTSGNYIIDNTERIVPINREILRVSAPYKEIQDLFPSTDKIRALPLRWKEYPMTVNVTQVTRYTNQVDIRCHGQGEDHANIFVIAFPFNGMIKPLGEDPRYRVYKGFISSSIKPFFHNSNKYRKILYLVIEINKNLFREDHRYHTDDIAIDLESFALFDDRNTGEKKTNHETFHLHITSPCGDYRTEWEREVINEPVMMHMTNTELWPLFIFSSRDRMDIETPKPTRNGRKKSIQRPITVEGNTMVTTNKHGIRKEIPITNRRYNKHQDRDRIDYMIEKSGMRNNGDQKNRRDNNRKKYNHNNGNRKK